MSDADLHERIEQHYREVDAAQAQIVKDDTGKLYRCRTCKHKYWRKFATYKTQVFIGTLCPCTECCTCPYCGIAPMNE